MNSLSPMSRQPFKVREESDIFAMVSTVFGFHPSQSLVMMLLDEGRPFLARTDLPLSPTGQFDSAAVDGLCDVLRQAILNNYGSQGFLVAYAERSPGVDEALVAVGDLLQDLGVTLLSVLQTDGLGWRRARHRRPLVWSQRHLYDISSHPLVVSSVFSGAVVHENRQGLAATLECVDPLLRDEVAEQLELITCQRGAVESAEEAAWLAMWLAERATADPGVEPSPAHLGRAMAAISNMEVRDQYLESMTTRTAGLRVGPLRALLQVAPDVAVAPVAGLLAFCAWLSGNGGLAWCAIDRCRAHDPGHNLARLVSQALDCAMPPSTWNPNV